MKKTILISILITSVLIIAGCTSQNNQENTSNTESSEQQIPNPFTEFDNLEDAKEFAGFDVNLPEVLPDGYKEKNIEVIKDNLIQVTYEKDAEEITFRQSNNLDSTSGDYTEYSKEIKETLGDINVTLKGSEENKIFLGFWENQGNSYSLFSDSGLSKSAMLDIIKSVK